MLKRMMSDLVPTAMTWRIVASGILLLLVLTLSLVACASSTSIPAATPTLNPKPKPSGLIEATWIEPQVDGDIVSFPVSEVENNWNIHFKLEAEDGDINFMAYIVDGEIYVRSAVCPRGSRRGFSLINDVLICNGCSSAFKAKTGEGIEGACVGFPKAPVPYKITNGNIIMDGGDLIAAHQNTLKPGLP